MATERTRLLVDAGLSRKETFERLQAIDIDPESLTAILITHEHTDHVAGMQAIARAHGIPVYLTRLTADSIDWDETPPHLEFFRAGENLTIGDIDVSSFTVPHDASDPVGFSLRAEGIKVSIATDLGYLPDSIRFHLRGSTVLLLESNHSLEMLKVGPYPWPVKQRVMSRVGHLSNDAACDFIRRHLDLDTAKLILGHLSEHNNHPELVRRAAMRALDGRSLFTELIVAPPKLPVGPFLF